MKQIKMLSLMLSVLMICAIFLVATVQADDQLMDANPVGKATIIVSTYQDNAVVKLDSNGNILWATDVGGNVFQAVENPTDKTIYAVGEGKFTKLSRDGAILLQKPISGSTIDVDPSDGSFYVGDYAESFKGMRKYDVNGNFIKSFAPINSSVPINGADPVVYRADGSVYTNSYSEGVYKFDKNGKLLWQKEPGNYWHNSYGFATIVVDQRDGSVVATAQDFGGENVGYVVRFDTDGNTLWARPIQDLTYSRNAIDPTENVVYGSADPYGDKLYKINLTNGEVIWSKSIGGSPRTPSVDSFDGSIYVGKAGAKEIVKVDKNGNILWGPKYIGYQIWYLETASDVASSPVSTTIPEIDLTGDEDVSTLLFNPYPEPSLLSESDKPYLKNLTELFNEEIDKAILDFKNVKAITALAASWGYPRNLVVVALGQDVNGCPITESVNAQSTENLPQSSGFCISRADFVTTFADDTKPKDTSLALFGTADPLVEVTPSISLFIENGLVKMRAGQFGSSKISSIIAPVVRGTPVVFGPEAGVLTVILVPGAQEVAIGLAVVIALKIAAEYVVDCFSIDSEDPLINISPSAKDNNNWHRSVPVSVSVSDNCAFAGYVGRICIWSILPYLVVTEKLTEDGEYDVFVHDISKPPNVSSEVVRIDTTKPTVTKNGTVDSGSGVLSVSFTDNGNCKYSGLPFPGTPRPPESSNPKVINVPYTISVGDNKCKPCETTLTAKDVAGNVTITTPPHRDQHYPAFFQSRGRCRWQCDLGLGDGHRG